LFNEVLVVITVVKPHGKNARNRFQFRNKKTDESEKYILTRKRIKQQHDMMNSRIARLRRSCALNLFEISLIM